MINIVKLLAILMSVPFCLTAGLLSGIPLEQNRCKKEQKAMQLS